MQPDKILQHCCLFQSSILTELSPFMIKAKAVYYITVVVC